MDDSVAFCIWHPDRNTSFSINQLGNTFDLSTLDFQEHALDQIDFNSQQDVRKFNPKLYVKDFNEWRWRKAD